MEIILLKEAKKLGLKRYFTGKPCKYGHVSERFTSARKCIECNRISVKKDYYNNKEEYNKRSCKWARENSERNNENSKNWYKSNTEKDLKVKKKEYRKKKEWLEYPYLYFPDNKICKISDYPTIINHLRNASNFHLFLTKLHTKLPRWLKILTRKIHTKISK